MAAQSSKTHLVLFDIDGTLIASDGAGASALVLAVREYFGQEDGLDGVDTVGRTDMHIALAIFEKLRTEPTPERVTAFLDRYVAHLARELPKGGESMLPGVVELLEALKARPHFVVALLTGNLARSAELKLTRLGLWHYFEFGAFGDEHVDRNQLAAIAQARALQRHGVVFSRERIFVVGDTPHDIACGRSINARTVAVATGHVSRDALVAHHPDYLFNDFGDVNGILSDLTGH